MIRSYLVRRKEETIERAQFLYMRTALAIHGGDITAAIATYEALSTQLYTHASPTLFNAGTKTPYCASCFVVQPDTHSPQSVLKTVSDLDNMWMADGGIGISLAGVPCER